MNNAIRNVCWALIGLAILASVVGAYFSQRGSMFLLTPDGYWRGVVALLLFAIALRMMEKR
jgi:uncharacterized membrane protein YfcA